ncbi:MAG: autotransporter outer membrane beta-barrel domain-containing protein [Fusobacteriaceae bacterium]
MKKILCLLLIVTCYTATYSQYLKGNNINETNGYYITEKGKTFMRRDLTSLKENSGASGSTQNIEYLYGKSNFDTQSGYKGYSTRTQGIVTGTTSNFKVTENSMWLTGVSFGYLRNKVDYDGDMGKEDTDTVGVNAYLGYNINDYLLLGYVGGTKGNNDHSGDRDNLLIGFETGKFFKIGQKHTLYPYASIERSRVFADDYSYDSIKYGKSIENYSIFNTGLNYKVKIDKFELKLFTKYSDVLTDTNSISIRESGIVRRGALFDSYEDSISFGGTLTYYIDPDLYGAFDIMNIVTNNNNYAIYSLRLCHIF